MIVPISWPSVNVARYSTHYWGRVAVHALVRGLARSIADQQLCIDLRALAEMAVSA